MEEEKKIWTKMNGNETAFSSIKRMFREYTSATNFKT